MTRKLLVLCMITLVALTLAPLATVSAQETPDFVLTEEQINEDFSLPSTATRTISDLVVDVKEDGVHVSFNMTTVRDGTSNTVSIIAILIGLYQPRVSAINFYDLLITSFTPPPTVRREVSNMLVRAWKDYAEDAVAQNITITKSTDVSSLLSEEGIYFFTAEAGSSDPGSVGWCLECSKP